MKAVEEFRIFTILCVLAINAFVCMSQDTFFSSKNSSCVQAESEVSLSQKRASCVFYLKTGQSCENIVGNQYVFDINGDDLRLSKILTANFENYISFYKISDRCKPVISELYCRYLLPLCDTSLSKPYPRQICRTSCVFALHVLCKRELAQFREIAGQDSALDPKMINCSMYPLDSGGEAPECYQYHSLPGDETKSKDCYYGIGVGYRGNVNITRSGRPCQPWASQCPHRHWRFPEDVVDGQNDSNMCRNPDASAPDGPWCYTADPKVRWEYCNISRCPSRVPENPGFLEGYPFNSTTIYIFWKSIPPSLHKEQLLGYRIQYRRLGSQLYSDLNVTSNITETVISRLDSQTSYEVKVNGFNENGQGQPGNILVVKTLQEGEILNDVNFTFIFDTKFQNELLNSSSNEFRAMENKIRFSVKLQFNDSSPLKIYDIRVLRFSGGSVKADILVLTKVEEQTSKAKVSTFLMDAFDTVFKNRLGISAVIVNEKPPAPRSLKVTNVQSKYIVLTWESPRYGSNFHIHNYTVERRKEHAKSFTVVATLPYTQTGMIMEDLEPATEYTIRMSSNNEYGRSDDGASLTLSTSPNRFIKKLMLTIILPLGLAVFFVLFVYLKFRPTCSQSEQQEKMVIGERGNWIELPRSAVEFKEKLGEGAFGEVFKGVVRISGKFTICAIKKLKANATEVEKRDLKNELEIMATAGKHPNLVSLLGACTETEPVLVVVRLAQNGCLLDYLRKSREHLYINVEKSKINFELSDRVGIARDIANGMLHLSNRKCIHRDLAARNVLLDENFVAMVSDFGLSRDVYESGAYENTSGGVLPVRWMALESLVDYTYSTKTDVWSFGVVLWEIESGGEMPYPGLAGMELVDFLKSGKRLRQPDGCPDNIFNIMTSCWHPDPSQRPSFNEIVTSLDQALQAIRINPTDETTESTLQGNINVALVTDETNDDSICMNTRDEISQFGLPAKDDLGSEAEKQKHSEIRSSLGDQISLCELPRTLTEGSESHGQIKNQRKQNQSVKSNLYV
ncbi:unnamed protein product [Porites evermanni]|uniref:receptor protein-tyrosine kinase n=1 Tax=Porites evermanni TaxID=104178 RepID=A0ABN8M620_9CNID|nr:unnamed protein product [Porites evermanni]